jgi:N-acetylglutamate synthase-like GNAT family acetyltransferase
MDGLALACIDPGSPAYAQMLDLRDRVLRRPLGMVLSAHDTARDASADLLVAQLEGRVVGCCLLTVEGPGLVQLRAMAVEPGLQGHGVGRAIVTFAEARGREKGARELQLDARVSALGFYARLGYVAEGGEYTKVGLPHRLMRKRLL